ncbi:hypothetical protein J2W97_001289 [Paenibacillus jamilae]|nr:MULTISPECIES: hypothetical protein [unclassified Paenibacillus]KAF6620539.1 hypothetical protein HFE00_05665 [Paenibacillus sp. EKM101P]KAF6623531.1 hypothetical protein HFE03_07760 [Paenibacillus sp. EKM102P]KAF6649433.1 hypothetical protein HFE02_01710 [Paenibacillus sp. EKM11P]MDP9675306.1 hypothetical protein [Paenibacillus jamilae]
MITKVQDYVDTMIKKLESEGHRDIQFLSASDCTFVKNGIKEGYLMEETNLNKICSGINLNEIEDGVEVVGSKLRIFSIPKRKRKGVTSVYYVVIQ